MECNFLLLKMVQRHNSNIYIYIYIYVRDSESISSQKIRHQFQNFVAYLSSSDLKDSVTLIVFGFEENMGEIFNSPYH